MFVFEGKSLPPFLIMKDDGEVWQLATGEASVCWKCGQSGHIGDKCRQAVNVLADSLASPAVGVQPSWAHVVKGGISVVPIAPPPPPHPQPQPITSAISSASLNAAKNSLKKVQTQTFKSVVKFGKVVVAPVAKVTDDADNGQIIPREEAATSPAIDSVDKDGQELALPPAPAMEVALEDEIEQAGFSLKHGESSVGDSAPFGQHKKARLSQYLDISSAPNQLSSSPKLLHKIPSGPRQQQQNVGDSDDGGGVHTNMFGINYVMWFDISIEGKSSMDPDEEDWGGKVEFGFGDINFPKDFEDYFLLMEDECLTQSHACAGRIMGVLFSMRDKVLKPPSYDPRNVVDLIDKYRDAHIMDSGWREVDTEEWVAF